MKRTSFSGQRRILAMLLAWILMLTMLPVNARAASSSRELPDLSAFLGSKYTQNKITQYSRLVTCIHDKDEGTKPLEEFLALLQEDRYQLELDSVSKEYPDSYSTATCKDYFFHYTGTSSKIQWITLKNGTRYHARVTLYTYDDKDYTAIVFYSHPEFQLKDSGVHYGDRPTGGSMPDPEDYFGKAAEIFEDDEEKEYVFSFSSCPDTKMRKFADAMEDAGSTAGKVYTYSTGSKRQTFEVDGEEIARVRWRVSSKELAVIVDLEELEEAGWQIGQQPTQPAPTTPTPAPAPTPTQPSGDETELKNGETAEVREAHTYRIKKGSKVTLHCTYDANNHYDVFEWNVISGSSNISISSVGRDCEVKALSSGTAQISMKYSYSYTGTNVLTGLPQNKNTSLTRVYTIIVD